MRFMLTPDTVLRAITKAAAPRSVYIRDELCRLQARAVAKGAKGSPPTSQQVLRRLRQLERDGFLTCSRFADGLYGYSWTITDKGNLRLLMQGCAHT